MLFVLNEDYAKREGRCSTFLTKTTLKREHDVDVINEFYARKGREMLFVLNEDYAKGKGGAVRS